MNSTEEFITNNRCFILGAGFSAAAGVPLTKNLLKLTMMKFKEECPGIYEGVKEYSQTYFQLGDSEPDFSSLDFSQLCTYLHYRELIEYGGGTCWSEAGSRENLVFKYYLAKTIVENTPQGDKIPELYIDFARQLRCTDTILNFNWDCLLEAALDKIGTSYSYYEGQDCIKIFKLHGSVNWRIDLPKKTNNTLEWASQNLSNGNEHEVYCSRKLNSFDTWQKFKSLSEVEPYLILPGFGKAFDIRRVPFLWYKPSQAFQRNHNIYIIGLSLAPDDFFIQNYFCSTLPYICDFTGIPERKITIINPDPETKNNYNFITTASNAKFLCEKFSIGHVKRFSNSEGCL